MTHLVNHLYEVRGEHVVKMTFAGMVLFFWLSEILEERGASVSEYSELYSVYSPLGCNRGSSLATWPHVSPAACTSKLLDCLHSEQLHLTGSS